MAIGTTMTKRKRSVHYVNNKEFLEALIDYRQRVAIAEQRGDPKPQISNYIGDCFLKDCNTPIIQTKLCQLHLQR